MLFAVAVVGAWLGYYIHWREERREARAWMDAQGIGGSIGFEPEPRPELPWMLRLLGEQPETHLLMKHAPSMRSIERVPREYERLVQRVKDLFPEAQVVDLNEGFGPDEANSASDH